MTDRLLVRLRGSYITRDAYERRVREAYGRVEALGLSRAWIAGAIGLSRGHVTHVLNGHADGPETLLLTEGLLERVEAEVGV